MTDNKQQKIIPKVINLTINNFINIQNVMRKIMAENLIVGIVKKDLKGEIK